MYEGRYQVDLTTNSNLFLEFSSLSRVCVRQKQKVTESNPLKNINFQMLNKFFYLYKENQDKV